MWVQVITNGDELFTLITYLVYLWKVERYIKYLAEFWEADPDFVRPEVYKICRSLFKNTKLQKQN